MRGSCAWCSVWVRGPLIVRTTTTRGSWPSTPPTAARKAISIGSGSTPNAKFDVIDLEANHFISYKFADVTAGSPELPLHIFASHNGLTNQENWSDPSPSHPTPVLTFKELLSQTPFVGDMREMLRVLQAAYDYPVDLEFTANFSPDGDYKINLVQCRPLQVASDSGAVEPPPKVVDPADLRARGPRRAVIGRSRANLIDRLIYVTPPSMDNSPSAIATPSRG